MAILFGAVMPGIMLVKQRVESVERWDAVFSDPELDATRRRHGLVVTGTYRDADSPETIVVVLEMSDLQLAREFAASAELASARERAGAVGSPDGVWLGGEKIR
jgi:hypothetical protein